MSAAQQVTREQRVRIDPLRSTRVREESRPSQELPGQLVVREVMTGIMHHCFEDIEVPAMQAGLQQPALLIDDAVDDPLGRGVDVGFPCLLCDQSNHPDEVARSAAGVIREIVEQRLRDEPRTTKILGPAQEQPGEESLPRPRLRGIARIQHGLVHQGQALEPRHGRHCRVPVQRERSAHHHTTRQSGTSDSTNSSRTCSTLQILSSPSMTSSTGRWRDWISAINASRGSGPAPSLLKACKQRREAGSVQAG